MGDARPGGLLLACNRRSRGGRSSRGRRGRCITRGQGRLARPGLSAPPGGVVGYTAERDPPPFPPDLRRSRYWSARILALSTVGLFRGPATARTAHNGDGHGCRPSLRRPDCRLDSTCSRRHRRDGWRSRRRSGRSSCRFCRGHRRRKDHRPHPSRRQPQSYLPERRGRASGDGHGSLGRGLRPSLCQHPAVPLSLARARPLGLGAAAVVGDDRRRHGRSLETERSVAAMARRPVDELDGAAVDPPRMADPDGRPPQHALCQVLALLGAAGGTGSPGYGVVAGSSSQAIPSSGNPNCGSGHDGVGPCLRLGLRRPSPSPHRV